jgi:hypothetical protein
MRSEAIFRAKKMIDNKYELCQAASKTTRRMHVASNDTQATITKAFETIAEDAKVPDLVRVVA